MEWVEITGRTIEEAKDALLDQLGVQEDEAEFEVLEEPKAGLFGRTRGQARVRARVQPKSPRAKEERRRRPAKAKSDTNGANGAGGSATTAAQAETPPAKQAPREARPPSEARPVDDRPRLDAAIAVTEATAFLQDFVARFGLTATVVVAVNDEGDLEASVDGTGLGKLIGPRGGMIRATEELVRTRLQHAADGGSTPKLRLDIGGYRQLRRDTIVSIADEAIAAVRETGVARVLDVVMAGERKAVHDRVGEVAHDLTTRSEGEDPQRRVMVLPV